MTANRRRHIENVGRNLARYPGSRRVNSLRPSDAYLHQQTNHHWFRQCIVAWPAPSHYLNQCWNIVNWTLGNKLQWNFNRNSNIFIQEIAFENVVCEMASILSRPQCVYLDPCLTWPLIRCVEADKIKHFKCRFRIDVDRNLIIAVPACISNHMPSKVWDKISYPLLNFNGATVKFRNG